MGALAESLISTNDPGGYNFNPEDEDEEDETRFHNVCIDEIERYRRMDEWIPSYHNIYSVTALDCKRRLAQGKVIPIRVTDFLQYTRDGTFDPLRLAAFTNMVELGLLKNEAVLEWFLSVLGSDPSPFVRRRMQRLFGKGLGIVAIGEATSQDVSPQQSGLIIEQESSTESRQADLARKQSVSGALSALKQETGSNAVLKKALWEAVTSPETTLSEIRDLLDICCLLYEPINSMIIALKYPRFWKVENLGHVRPHKSSISKLELTISRVNSNSHGPTRSARSQSQSFNGHQLLVPRPASAKIVPAVSHRHELSSNLQRNHQRQLLQRPPHRRRLRMENPS